MMLPRIQILKDLLKSDNGTLLVSINDDEGHYLKIICDEVFGRSNFVGSFVWHYEGNTDNQADIINYHEYILVYSTKGELTADTGDTERKRSVGQLWEKVSNKRGVFLIVEKERDGLDMRAQMINFL